MSLPLIEPLETRIAPASFVSVTDVLAAESDNGTGTTFTFKVQLSSASSETVTVDFTTSDGSAIAGTDYTTESNTLTFNPGETEKEVSVPVTGNDVADADRDFFLNLSNVTGDATIFDGQGKGTIADDDIGVTISDASAVEKDSGTAPAEFVITLERPSLLPVTVNLQSVAGGTATANLDHATGNGPLTFLPGETESFVQVSVFSDFIKEADETFLIKINSATNANITDDIGVGTIIDNDPIPSITIGDVSQQEGNDGETSFVFPVTLSNPSSVAVEVDWTTAPGGTAQAGVDFVAASGTVTIAAGSTQDTITVTVNGDTLLEPNEDFFVTLTNPIEATISDGTGHGVIGAETLVGPNPFVFSYTDIDGDLVTIKASKPIFDTQQHVDAILHFAPGDAGSNGLLLSQINLKELGKIKLSVTAEAAGGGDGNADVTFVQSTSNLQSLFIDGNLGSISATRIGTLEVGSFGASVAPDGTPVFSEITKSLNRMVVHGDFQEAVLTLPRDSAAVVKLIQIDGDLLGGSVAGTGQIIGGTVRKMVLGTLDGNGLPVHGNLVGGSGASSGVIQIERIGTLLIRGDILGGDFVDSSHTAELTAQVRSGQIHYLETGGVIGGTGDHSAGIVIANGKTTKAVTIHGDVHGDSGIESGSISITSNIRKFLIDGNIEGGDGVLSGSIYLSRTVGTMEVAGNLTGGTADLTGVIGNIDITFIDGNGLPPEGSGIRHLTIGGSIVGGDNQNADPDEPGSKRGFMGAVITGHLGTVQVDGDVIAGSTFGAKLTNSGVIRAQFEIGSVAIGGDLKGSDTNAAIISAVGKQKVSRSATRDLAIGSVSVGGSIQDSEILAGYFFDPNPGPRGVLKNADASIGTVQCFELLRSNIVAGVDPGPASAGEPEPFFGNGDDARPNDPLARDSARIVSQISAIVVTGSVLGTADLDEQSYAVTAQWVRSVTIDTVAVALAAGASNDLAPDNAKRISNTPGDLTELPDGFDFHVVEVA